MAKFRADPEKGEARRRRNIELVLRRTRYLRIQQQLEPRRCRVCKGPTRRTRSLCLTCYRLERDRAARIAREIEQLDLVRRTRGKSAQKLAQELRRAAGRAYTAQTIAAIEARNRPIVSLPRRPA